MVDQIEVLPLEDGTWEWRKRIDDRIVASVGGKEASRSEAIAAARSARGDEEVQLVRGDGSTAGTARIGGGLRVVLLRSDGSEYGELDHGSSVGQAQAITLASVDETTGATGL